MLVMRRLLWVRRGGGKGSGPSSPGSVNAHLSARLTQRNWWWAPGFLPHWRSDPPSTQYAAQWGKKHSNWRDSIQKIAPQDKLLIMKAHSPLFLDRLLYVVFSNLLLFVRWNYEQDRTHRTCRPHAHWGPTALNDIEYIFCTYIFTVINMLAVWRCSVVCLIRLYGWHRLDLQCKGVKGDHWQSSCGLGFACLEAASGSFWKRAQSENVTCFIVKFQIC